MMFFVHRKCRKTGRICIFKVVEEFYETIASCIKKKRRGRALSKTIDGRYYRGACLIIIII